MSHPNTNYPSNVVLTREESMRVHRFIVKVGIREATKRLRVGQNTLEAAREQGRMMRKTRDRLFEALEREEAQTP